MAKTTSIEFKGRKYMVLDVNTLVTDPEYQRNLNNNHVAALENSYDPTATRTIVVNRRPNGTYVVIDGMHRRAAMIKAKDNLAMCEVHDGLMPAQEALLFTRLNSCKPLKGLDLFRSRYFSGDHIACSIVTLLKSHGFNLKIDKGKERNPRTLDCAQTLYNIFQRRGEEVFRRMFSVIVKAYENDDTIERSALKADFLEGLAIALNDRSNMTTHRISSLLTDFCPGEILAEGNRNCGARNGFKVVHAVAAVIVHIFDTGRMTKNKSA